MFGLFPSYTLNDSSCEYADWGAHAELTLYTIDSCIPNVYSNYVL